MIEMRISLNKVSAVVNMNDWYTGPSLGLPFSVMKQRDENFNAFWVVSKVAITFKGWYVRIVDMKDS